MKFVPLGDKIRIKPDSVQSVTASGLDIPDSAKDKPVTGVVMAIGPKVNSHLKPEIDAARWEANVIRHMDDPATEAQKKILSDLESKGIKVGDRVVFSEFAGTKVKVDGEDILYVKESDCHFVITPEREMPEIELVEGKDYFEVIKDLGTEGSVLRVLSSTRPEYSDTVYDPTTMTRGWITKVESCGPGNSLTEITIESVNGDEWVVPQKGKTYGLFSNTWPKSTEEKK